MGSNPELVGGESNFAKSSYFPSPETLSMKLKVSTFEAESASGRVTSIVDCPFFTEV